MCYPNAVVSGGRPSSLHYEGQAMRSVSITQRRSREVNMERWPNCRTQQQSVTVLTTAMGRKRPAYRQANIFLRIQLGRQAKTRRRNRTKGHRPQIRPLRQPHLAAIDRFRPDNDQKVYC